MSGAPLIVLAVGLVVVFIAVVALMAWQEAQQRPDQSVATYVIEDAVRFVNGRLNDETRKRLAGGGILRILEWEIYYLQGLAQKSRRNPVETVAGGSDASIDYIEERIATVHGVTYDRSDIAAVLRLEADYLVSIGAVGEPVDPQDLQAQEE